MKGSSERCYQEGVLQRACSNHHDSLDVPSRVDCRDEGISLIFFLCERHIPTQKNGVNKVQERLQYVGW
jgi:hypothetical protein